MSEPTPSKAVADAVEFLWGIFEDARSMLASIEAAMDRADWQPIARNFTAPSLKSTLQGEEWLLWWGFRFYVPKSTGDTFNRLIIVSACFGPDDDKRIDYATLTAAAVRFPRPTTFDDVWEKWESTVEVSLATLGRNEVTVLASASYARFTPKASAVAAVAFPLCELSSDEAVLTRLVKPLVEAEKKLGATK